MNENFDKLLNKLKILAEAVKQRHNINNQSYEVIRTLKDKINDIFGVTTINFDFSIMLTKNLSLEIERDNIRFKVNTLKNSEIEKIGVSNYILKELKNIDFYELEKTIKEYLKENEKIKGELDE